MSKNLLIIFAKNPELGTVKTRLAKTIGKSAALEVYIKLLERTISITENLNLDKVVYYHERIGTDDLWNTQSFKKALQKGSDLGEKMNDAFQSAYAEGYDNVCIIGSDCFELTTVIINKAFTALKSKEAVIGAAEDGGYYLLGTAQYHPEFFEGKVWSTDTVFSSTINDFKKLALSYTELPVLRDVDVEADLGDWAKSSDIKKITN